LFKPRFTLLFIQVFGSSTNGDWHICPRDHVAHISKEFRLFETKQRYAQIWEFSWNIFLHSLPKAFAAQPMRQMTTFNHIYLIT